MKVCEKVQKKGVTTYNEVADELVAEFSSADNHISPNDAVSFLIWLHWDKPIIVSPLFSVIFQKQTSRWTGYSILPLGINNSVNVCMMPCNGLVPHTQCYWDLLWLNCHPRSKLADHFLKLAFYTLCSWEICTFSWTDMFLFSSM